MTLTLHTLQKARGATRRRRRLGRGNASGTGTYSGRGLKGQRSRSGGKKKLKRKGLKILLQQKQKIGGFRSLRPKMATVNVGQLEAAFAAKAVVDAVSLQRIGLIPTVRAGLKVLGDGTLTKPLTVVADAFSENAKQAILKAGGKAQRRRGTPAAPKAGRRRSA